MNSHLHRNGKNYNFSSLQERCPPGTQLDTVVKMGRGKVRLTGSAGMRSGTDQPKNRCMLNQILAEWVEKWIWDHLELIEGYELAWLADTFRNGTALFICDGSYQQYLCSELGDAEWTIECTATGIRVRGVLQSITKDANAYK